MSLSRTHALHLHGLRHLLGCALLALALVAPPVCADDLPQFELTIENHRWQPSELKVPAGTKFKLVVINQDATPEEFESIDLKREKIVMPGGRISVFIGPLAPGSYAFFGDFHQDTAQGRLIAE